MMATTSARQLSRGILAMIIALALSVGVFAQSRPAAAPTGARDLNSTLAELTRVAPATNQDLAILQQHGARLQWVTFWRGDKAHNAQVSEALRRNLQVAVPSLIHDAQVSGGSLSASFKLYRDLTAVCESLESLLGPGSHENKTELAALSTDLSDMNRLREDLYSYMQQTAVSIESKNKQLAPSTGRLPKKIIVDDNMPDRTSPKKRRPQNQ